MFEILIKTSLEVNESNGRLDSTYALTALTMTIYYQMAHLYSKHVFQLDESSPKRSIILVKKIKYIVTTSKLILRVEEGMCSFVIV